jgi:two-component system NtrC family sensor kinase
VVVEFADTGPGLAEPNRIFDPFYSTKPLGKGTGLGLSACYGIVQEHGGQVLAWNRKEGGATFRVELPIAQTEPAPAATR